MARQRRGIRSSRINEICRKLNDMEADGKVRSWFCRIEPGFGRKWVIEMRGGSTCYLSTKEAEEYVNEWHDWKVGP